MAPPAIGIVNAAKQMEIQNSLDVASAALAYLLKDGGEDALRAVAKTIAHASEFHAEIAAAAYAGLAEKGVSGMEAVLHALVELAMAEKSLVGDFSAPIRNAMAVFSKSPQAAILALKDECSSPSSYLNKCLEYFDSIRIPTYEMLDYERSNLNQLKSHFHNMALSLAEHSDLRGKSSMASMAMRKNASSGANAVPYPGVGATPKKTL